MWKMLVRKMIVSRFILIDSNCAILCFEVSIFASQDCFPTLPILVQGALNATSICFEAVGEVELLSTIAMRACQILKDGQMPDFAKIAQLSAAGSVGLYASVLGKCVQSFGGGAPFEVIEYLASFSQQDKAVTLGREFVVAITDTEFSQNHLFPSVRVAFAVASLTAPKHKVQDGFSRFLNRSDVQALKGKKQLPKLLELENLMEKTWEEVIADTKDKATAYKATAYKAFGKLQVRSLLHLLKKSKHGHEDKTFADLDEIYKLFAVDITDMSQATSLQQTASSQSTSPSASHISFELKLGTLCTHKDHPGKVFKIRTKDDNGLQLEFIDPITKFQQLLDVDAGKVINFVKNTKAKLLTAMDAHALGNAFATFRCQKELEKCHAYIALMGMYEALDCDSSHIQVLSALSKIFAHQNFKTKDLTLVPITSSPALLSHDKPKEPFAPFLEYKNTELYIMQPKTYKEAKPEDGGIVAPFFHPQV